MKTVVVRACSVVLALMVVFSFLSVITFAEDSGEDSGLRLTYIDSYGGKIKTGLISTEVKAQIVGKAGVTKVKIKMELQKLSSGDYSTIETWEQTFYSDEGSMTESKITNPFSTYRLKATFTAYNGSNSETKTLYVNE